MWAPMLPLNLGFLLTDLALIRQAANEPSPDSHYFEQVPRQWAMHYDWYSMLKAIFHLSVFLQWRSAYDDVVETQVHTYLQFGLNVTLDMLTGRGQYIDPVSQSMISLHAYFQQVSDLAFKALKLCMPQDSVNCFCSLVQ